MASLEAQFVQDADIANHLGMTVGGIQAIKKSPEYRAAILTRSTGILSVYDQQFASTAENQKLALDAMVPQALFSLGQILRDRSHKEHVKVALDVLDRNKATAKISRTELSVAPTKDLNRENEAANELLSLLSSVPDPQTQVLNIEYNPTITIDATITPVVNAQEAEEDNEAHNVVVN